MGGSGKDGGAVRGMPADKRWVSEELAGELLADLGQGQGQGQVECTPERGSPAHLVMGSREAV